MFAKPKKVCQYDGNCYRKNPKHFQEYSHPKQYPDPTVLAPAQAAPHGAPMPAAHASDRHATDVTAPSLQAEDSGTKDSPSPFKRARPEPVGVSDAPPEGLSGAERGSDPRVEADTDVGSTPLGGSRTGGLSVHGTPASLVGGAGGASSTYNTSFTDGYDNESFASTAPTEIVRELSTSSSYVAPAAARRTPPTALPIHVRPYPVPLAPTQRDVSAGNTTGMPGGRTGETNPIAAHVAPVFPAQPVTAHFTKRDALKEDEETSSTDVSVDSQEEESRGMAPPANNDDSTGTMSHGSLSEADARELQEDIPCAQLLEYLLQHDPIRECVDTGASDNAAEDGRGERRAEEVGSDFDGVGDFLQRTYSLGFAEDDMRAVLLAARALRPADPLHAFAGWRLVGPFELALRTQSHSATGNEAFTFKTEAARWRCGRFRHDPPECQTVAVECGPAGPARRHLCFFRDHPSDVPSMLVEGTDAAHTFAMVGGSLSGFLLARAAKLPADSASTKASKGKEEQQAVAAGLQTVLASISDTERRAGRYQALGLHEDGSAPSLTSQAEASTKHRKRTQVAATYHGLGMKVPYDKNTELGYRPLTLTRKRLETILKSWDADFATKVVAYVQQRTGPAGGDAQVPRTNATILSWLHEREKAFHQDEAGASRAFTTSDWNDIHEQFRYADMANDEGDFGLNLELGLDIFSLIEAPSLLPEASHRHAGDAHKRRRALGNEEEEDERVEEENGGEGSSSQGGALTNPLLWHAFRILDCVYMLTGRDLYRHILRCHLPVLAGQQAVLLDSASAFR